MYAKNYDILVNLYCVYDIYVVSPPVFAKFIPWMYVRNNYPTDLLPRHLVICITLSPSY